jgi:hypothetical protein
MPNGIAFLYLLYNNSFYFILNMLFLILFFDNHQEFIVVNLISAVLFDENIALGAIIILLSNSVLGKIIFGVFI